MPFKINETRMINDAALTMSEEYKRRSAFIDVAIFFLISLICTAAQGITVFACGAVSYLFNAPSNPEITTLRGFELYLDSFSESLPQWANGVFLISYGFMIICSIFYCRRMEKRSLFSMGFGKTNSVAEYAVGGICGLALFSLIALICIMMGNVEIVVAPSQSIPLLILYFFAFLIQGLGEEVLFRGYLMNTLSVKLSLHSSVIISALIFAILHAGNSSFSIIAFFNIFLFGIFAGTVMIKRGSIWAVAAIHSFWNFVQGNIFGFSVSGNSAFSSVFVSSSSDGAQLWNGGGFGPEGGIIATAILILACLAALVIPTKKSEEVG